MLLVVVVSSFVVVVDIFDVVVGNFVVVELGGFGVIDDEIVVAVGIVVICLLIELSVCVVLDKIEALVEAIVVVAVGVLVIVEVDCVLLY